MFGNYLNLHNRYNGKYELTLDYSEDILKIWKFGRDIILLLDNYMVSRWNLLQNTREEIVNIAKDVGAIKQINIVIINNLQVCAVYYSSEANSNSAYV